MPLSFGLDPRGPAHFARRRHVFPYRGGKLLRSTSIKSNKFIRLYGSCLLPELYECYNPMSYDAALDMEIERAIHLRRRGYGSGRDEAEGER